MLASITPLGERGRRSNWGVTVTAFLIGATVAAAGAGAALGALGSVVVPARPRVALLLAAIGVAIALDALPRRVPGPRRQVDERWLDQYRGWVYGAGFGAQLGLGVTTIVSSAATYVTVVAALETASPPAGAVVLGCFGAVRGLTPFAAAGVRSQRRLLEFHRALGRWRAPARWSVVATLAGLLVLGLSLS
jgi:cytochrome c biogenesis protein CcdA